MISTSQSEMPIPTKRPRPILISACGTSPKIIWPLLNSFESTPRMIQVASVAMNALIRRPTTSMPLIMPMHAPSMIMMNASAAGGRPYCASFAPADCKEPDEEADRQVEVADYQGEQRREGKAQRHRFRRHQAPEIVQRQEVRRGEAEATTRTRIKPAVA